MVVSGVVSAVRCSDATGASADGPDVAD